MWSGGQGLTAMIFCGSFVFIQWDWVSSLPLLFLFGGAGMVVVGGIVFLELPLNDHFDKGTKALILIGTVFEIKVTAVIRRASFPGD